MAQGEGRLPSTCLELAQEGERLCRDNNFVKGIEFLLQAIKVGTDDVHTLSAIYSQLGNAYFSIRAYAMALEYHNHDLMITRFMGDKLGEMKASANVGHTYKATGKFKEAITFTNYQLRLARSMEEGQERMASESRALYNLATIYQLRSRTAQKSLASVEDASSNTEQQNSYMDDLNQSIAYYLESLELSEELQDILACGRTYGCLGNAYYMLRDFEKAIDFHFKRLDTARQFGDKAAMRRAYTSLANAHVFLPNMMRAIEFYRLALGMAVEMNDPVGEAQACFSLGNASSLVNDHNTALEFHERHLRIARELEDRAGEARAFSSMASDLRAQRQYGKAIFFLALRRRLAKEMHDESMVESSNEAMRAIITEAGEDIVDESGEIRIDASMLREADSPPVRLSRSLRSLHEDSGDCGLSRVGLLSASDGDLASGVDSSRDMAGTASQDDFFDMLSRMQSKRLDEQRCDPIILSDVTNRTPRQTDQLMLSPSASSLSSSSHRRRSIFSFSTLKKHTKSSKSLSRFMASSSTTPAPGTVASSPSGTSTKTSSLPSPSHSSRSFVSLPTAIFKVPRFPSRRSTKKLASSSSLPEEPPRRHSLAVSTMKGESLDMDRKTNGPDAFFDLIMAAQGRRMEEQRAPLLPGLSDQGLIQKWSQEPRSGLEGTDEIDNHLMEMVMRAQQRGRLNDQRSDLPGRRASESVAQDPARRPMTIPEDDISELVARMQMGRMEEQRATLRPLGEVEETS